VNVYRCDETRFLIVTNLNTNSSCDGSEYVNDPDKQFRILKSTTLTN